LGICSTLTESNVATRFFSTGSSSLDDGGRVTGKFEHGFHIHEVGFIVQHTLTATICGWAAKAVTYGKLDAWYVTHLHIFLLFLLLFADPNLLGIPFRLSTKIIQVAYCTFRHCSALGIVV
jgi:hypothetical protein